MVHGVRTFKKKKNLNKFLSEQAHECGVMPQQNIIKFWVRVNFETRARGGAPVRRTESPGSREITCFVSASWAIKEDIFFC